MSDDRRLHLELHIIQNFAPNNLNRDDVGSPKECVFGGVRRARISSQALKRSMRTHPTFQNAIRAAGGDVGIRTRLLKTELDRKLAEMGESDEDARDVMTSFLIEDAFGLKLNEKRQGETQYLLYVGRNELDLLAGALQQHREEILGGDQDKQLKKDLKGIVSGKGKAYAADVALFGRMVADDKTMNVDATCQVAHSISTHEVMTDIDYFTAVDDLNPESETGAGMIGQVELNGSCHYRYLNVDVASLQHNLGHNGDLTSATVGALVEAALLAIPTGKQNSTAAHNMPHYATVLIREDGRLWSLAGAFSKPVAVNDLKGSSFEEVSVSRLDAYLNELERAYGELADSSRFTLHVGDNSSMSLPRIVDSVKQRVDTWIAATTE
jgi:CRISPR system Cascade subunit CasC